MSIQHVAAVLYHMPELRQRARAFALLAIADSADRASGWTYHIALKHIAAAARLRERGTRNALHELEAGGYIRTDGTPGRKPRYRVLFDFNGLRRLEAELYPTPAPRAGVQKPPRHATTGTPARHDTTPAPRAGVPNNPNKESVLSVDIRKRDEQKLARPRIKKMPEPAETSSERRDRIEATRERTRAAMRERGVVT